MWQSGAWTRGKRTLINGELVESVISWAQCFNDNTAKSLFKANSYHNGRYVAQFEKDARGNVIQELC